MALHTELSIRIGQLSYVRLKLLETLPSCMSDFRLLASYFEAQQCFLHNRVTKIAVRDNFRGYTSEIKEDFMEILVDSASHE